MSKVQIKEVIQAVENMEIQMKDDLKRNVSNSVQQYQVHEDVKEMFVPETPIREDDEYFFEAGKLPENYFLPANQKPLTLQSVLRPSPNKPSASMRPPFRRPSPPEIKLRRPPPMYQKGNMGYPLPMPNYHGQHGPMKKQPLNFNLNSNRGPPNMNRLQSMPSVPPMKTMPPMVQHQQNKQNFNQLPPKKITKMPLGPIQSIIMGKPSKNTVQLPISSQTLNLGQTDIIANQVVKSQITLPGSNDALGQHSIIQTQTYMNKPGQIILGKPMDNPMPLDQQMTPTKQFGIRSPPTPSPTLYQSTTRISLKYENEQQNEIKSSDFMGESAEKSTIPPAVNTGFKPDSIVVESGFKPIIREPLMASEDRIADYEGGSNRREDTDVEDDFDEPPQYNSPNHQFPSDKMTETFEPMFIPSPPDHLLPTNDRTKEIFPHNHAKEDRPHPVYVKNESQKTALFSKKNTDRELPDDLVMESDRISPQYLPPDPKLPKEYSQKLSSPSEQTFTTYDGKTVSAATLTSVSDDSRSTTKLFSAKLPANSEQLLRTPQFGPFRGDIPPPVAAHINKDAQEASTIAQLSKTTQLKPIGNKKSGDLKAEGSVKSIITEKLAESEDIEEYEEDEVDEDSKLRERRETKTTQFEKGEIEEVQTNGHSMPRNQMEFEREAQATGAAPARRLYWMTHALLLTLCIKLL